MLTLLHVQPILIQQLYLPCPKIQIQYVLLHVQAEKQYKEKYVKLQEQYNMQLTKQSTLINQKEIYTKSYDVGKILILHSIL